MIYVWHPPTDGAVDHYHWPNCWSRLRAGVAGVAGVGGRGNPGDKRAIYLLLTLTAGILLTVRSDGSPVN